MRKFEQAKPLTRWMLNTHAGTRSMDTLSMESCVKHLHTQQECRNLPVYAHVKASTCA